LVQKFGSISNQIQVLWVNWEIWCLRNPSSSSVIREPWWECGFKLRKSAKFGFTNLVQFGTSFRRYRSPGKFSGSKMHAHAWWSHPSVSPWEECTPLNGENQWNFGLKIWFNLELVSGTVGHVRNLRPLKCIFMLDDHISTT
jgi:hypothetical protein